MATRRAFGLAGTSNNFTVNGAHDNDPFLNLNNSGPSNLLLGSNDIDQVNIVANAYSAQYGGLGGSQENITTRSAAISFTAMSTISGPIATSTPTTGSTTTHRQKNLTPMRINGAPAWAARSSRTRPSSS